MSIRRQRRFDPLWRFAVGSPPASPPVLQMHSRTPDPAPLGKHESSSVKTNDQVVEVVAVTPSTGSWPTPGAESDARDAHIREKLNRSLTPRHISMIAIAGVIGTGLYLGTGRSLVIGGPGALIINYSLIGFVVYLTMLALGEMSTFMPISGSFCSYAKKFGSDSFGFTLMCNYWFNDATSVASDLTALQLVLDYWNSPQNHFPFYAASLIVWGVLLILNVVHVRVYGETEYWLALLKIIAIVIFFIVSIVVNAGHNDQHEYIGFKWWGYRDAPFVNGFKGFASIFVTSSFAFGGTESITLTAGEAQNPIRNTPKVIRTVFWRILIFYVFTAFFIGMNVPYTYPHLSEKTVVTSPFTIVFQMVGSKAAGSFMNAVILTSVISAGNHALFAGSRVLYNLGLEGYVFPSLITRTNRHQVPYVAVILTWAVGGLCFGSSFIGAGTLWTWLQNIVGVSNQIAWLSIAVISIRFRQGLEKQGRTHELLFKNWTYPYGPYFLVVFVSFIILVQGWSAFAPWSTSSFFSYYLELFVFGFLWICWWVWKRDPFIKTEDMDFTTDRYVMSEDEKLLNEHLDSLKGWPKARLWVSENLF
ncbi:LAMI_0F14972g1_1 [Lachancea mirantina]|uniref:LAMI_0F14972g1_1 n=1 Tax=Lachancea mirantina TaxID=1230905 RepID=A0A1G4K463_9SACH|nr:LAMI_0F14972g1_1 [Lachancea mirantina]